MELTKRRIALAVALGILSGILMNFLNSDLAIVILLSVLLVIFLGSGVVRKRLGSDFLVIVLVLAFVLRLGFIVLNSYHTLPMNLADAPRFHELGVEILEKDFPSLDDLSQRGVHAYYGYFLATIYMAFGINKSMAILISTVFGLLASYNIFRISESMFGRKSAGVAFVISLIVPSFVLFSVAMVRDIIVLFCITEIFYLFILHRRGKQMRHLLYMLPFFVGMFYLRSEMVLLIGIPLAFTLVYDRIPQKRILIAVSAAIIVLVMLSPVFSQVMDRLDDLHSRRATGRTAYLADADFNTLTGFAVNIWPGVAYAFYSPLPHQVTDIRKELVPFAEVLVFIIFSFLIVFNTKTIRDRLRRGHGSTMIILMMYFLIYSLVYGIVDTNIGTAYRHRIQATFIIILLVSPILQDYYSKWKDETANFTYNNQA